MYPEYTEVLQMNNKKQLKIGKKFKQTLHKRRYMDDNNMFNIISHWENEPSHNKTVHYIFSTPHNQNFFF